MNGKIISICPKNHLFPLSSTSPPRPLLFSYLPRSLFMQPVPYTYISSSSYTSIHILNLPHPHINSATTAHNAIHELHFAVVTIFPSSEAANWNEEKKE